MNVDKMVALSAPTPRKYIGFVPRSFKAQGGGHVALAAPFIERGFHEQRLDDAVGPLNWQESVEVSGGVVIVTLSIFNHDIGGWISKAGVCSSKPDPQKDAGNEHIRAFKRAAKKWGIGRDLDDLRRKYHPVRARNPNQPISEKNFRFDVGRDDLIQAAFGGSPPREKRTSSLPMIKAGESSANLFWAYALEQGGPVLEKAHAIKDSLSQGDDPNDWDVNAGLWLLDIWEVDRNGFLEYFCIDNELQPNVSDNYDRFLKSRGPYRPGGVLKGKIT